MAALALKPSCDLIDVRCCVCGSTAARSCASGLDFEYETTGDTFRMVRCESCGMVYLNPRPSPGDLPTIYPKTYYAYNYEEEIAPLARRVKAWLDRRKVDAWLNVTPTAQPRFLDVGCGDGRFLEILHQKGIPKRQLWGLELSDKVVTNLQDRGFQARLGRIEDADPIGLPRGYFDLIVLLQVIEHIEHPAAVIRQLVRLLAPGGILVLETPNVKSLDRNLFKNRYWGGYHFPRHWHLFDPDTIQHLLTEHGLTPLSYRYLPSPSFWIYSLHHLAKDRWDLMKTSRFFNPFQNLPLLFAFVGFDILRAAAGGKTSNMQVIAVRSDGQ